MMLEHDTYREAVSDVTLSDEAGMEMLENAIQRKERWSQRWRVQTMAIVAGIVVVALSANGICFAATGMNAWDLLQTIYHGNSKEAEQISQNFQKVGDDLVDGNLRHTLEEYWYDADAGMVYFIIRTDSLDGLPLAADATDYVVSPEFNHHGLISVASEESVMSENKTSARTYFHAIVNYKEDKEKYQNPAKEAIASADALIVSLEVEDGGVNEDGEPINRELGSFVMEPTDVMKTKSLDLDYSALENCTGIKIVGGGMRMSFDKRFGKQNGEKNYPFEVLELKMKDGSSCVVVGELLEGDWEIVREDREIIGFKSDTKDYTGDKFLGLVGASGSGFDPYSKSGFSSKFNCTFNRFIDIDEVVGVYADGVELPIQ